MLILIWLSPAAAQPTGTIQSVGLGGYYRGDRWTPMLIRLHNDSSQAMRLRIGVRQYDLDRDIVNYTRDITLSGSQSADQLFWMYFIPQPTDGGLASPLNGATLADLARQLRVSIDAPDGKTLLTLTPNNMLSDLDRMNPDHGTRLILLVESPGARPERQAYFQLKGLLEDVVMVPLGRDELPEDAIGYSAVDAVVWLNAPPPDPRLPSQERRFAALEQYVRQGGRLVISQGAQWRQTAQAFGPMLPVHVTDFLPRRSLEPLRALAESTSANAPGIFAAMATPDAGTLVDLWMKWPAAGSSSAPSTTRASDPPTTAATKPASADIWTPCIARRSFGLGSVTWVAFDLGSRALTQAIPSGWAHIWDRIFDWHNESLPPNDPIANTAFAGRADTVNLGGTRLGRIDLPARTGGYIAIAVLFFILYWAAAGPLNHMLLMYKKRIELSWFVFAAAALGATALTVLIVQLLVRGPPVARHVTLIRAAPGRPAEAISQVGLYIPRDGAQTIRLGKTLEDRISDITPLPIPPARMPINAGFITPMEYDLPVPIEGQARSELTVPYRRTLKKLRVRWIGDLPGGIDGQAELVGAYPYLAGLLTNHLGRDLADVYFAFKISEGAGRFQDRVVYLPIWRRDARVDLWSILNDHQNRAVFVGRVATSLQAPPGAGRRINDALVYRDDPTRGWAGFWYGQFSGAGFGVLNLATPDNDQSFAMLSLFNLLPPMPIVGDHSRVDLLRAGTRFVDASAAVDAGRLLIFARDRDPDGAPPFPLTVMNLFGSTPVRARGTTYYQIILPLQRASDRP